MRFAFATALLASSAVAAVPTAGPVLPASGVGLYKVFTATYGDDSGSADINSAQMIIESSLSGVASCQVQWERSTNTFQVLYRQNAPDAWYWVTPVNGVSANPQCSIDAARSSKTDSGNILTVNFSVSFSSSYSGDKHIYLFASGNTSSSGWQTMTSLWTVGPGMYVDPPSSTVMSHVFTASYEDRNGAAAISAAEMMIESSLSGVASCQVRWDRATNLFQVYYRQNPADSWYLVTPVNGISPNPQCSISTSGSSKVESGNTLTVKFAVTFSTSYSGLKQLYQWVSGSAGGTYPGWRHSDITWTVGYAPPAPGTVSPAAGTGLKRVFTVTYQDELGATDINSAQMIIESSLSGVASCQVQWERSTNSFQVFYHEPAGGAYWVAPVNGTSANPQCAIDTAGSSKGESGNTLTVNFSITFFASYLGEKHIYLWASGSPGSSAWQTSTSVWTVGFANPSTVSVTYSNETGLTDTGLSEKFIATYQDVDGAENIDSAEMLIEASLTGVNSCQVRWDRLTNTFQALYHQPGSSVYWIPSVNGVSANPQCAVYSSASSKIEAGTTLTVTFAVSFFSSYQGQKSIWLFASAHVNAASSGWQTNSAWKWNVAPVLSASTFPTNESVNPASGPAEGADLRAPQVFDFVFTSGNGAAFINWTEMLFNHANSPVGGCFIAYESSYGAIKLAGDDGTPWPYSGDIGSATILQNSYCVIDLGSSTILTDFNKLTVRLKIAFKAALLGKQQVWMQSEESPAGANQPLTAVWQHKGVWQTTPDAARPPEVISVLPSYGTGFTQEFTYVGRSDAGPGYITQMTALFANANSTDPLGNCYVAYLQVENRLVLLGDSGLWDSAAQSATPEVGAPISNGHCTLYPAQSSKSASGNDLTLKLKMGFNANWTGLTKSNYLYVDDHSAASTGWITKGATWKIGTAVPPSVTGTTSSGTTGVPYTQTLIGTAGVQPYRSWQVASGSLPPGLVLSAAGLISGAPTLAGSYTANVTVTDYNGLVSASAPVTVTVVAPDFTITMSPNTSLVVAGGSASYTVSIAAVNGFSGTVTFSPPTGLPPGSWATFAPASIIRSGTTIMTVVTALDGWTGSTTLVATGNSGSLRHTSQSNALLVQDFSLGLSPSNQPVIVSGVATISISLGTMNGYNQPVALFVTAPQGLLGPFPPSTLSPGGIATFGFQPALPAGTTATVQIRGLSGGVNHYATASITVSSAGDFSIQPATSSQTLPPPGSVSYSMTVAAVNSFSGSVALSVAGVPSSATASFSPQSVTPGATSTMTISATAAVIGRTYPLTITGTSPGVVPRTATVYLVVPSAADFTLSAAQASQTIAPAGLAGYSMVVSASAAFNGAVSLSATNLPAGAFASFSPSSVNGEGTSNLTITTASSTPTGSFPILVTGQSGTKNHTAVIYLTIQPATPATMISPGAGSLLTSNPTTFLWKSATGASQHQLAVGATCGASGYYAAITDTIPTAACPDGTLQCQSATTNSISIASPIHSLCARLSSLVSGVWQYRDYLYEAGPSSPPPAANTIGLRYSTVISVLNDGKESPAERYMLCDSNSPAGQCANAGGWTGGLVGDTCKVTLNLGGEADTSVSVRVVRKGMADAAAPVNSVDLTFTAKITAVPGPLREATCSYNGADLNPLTFSVSDASPRIYTDDAGTSIGLNQLPPANPGGPFYVEVYGTTFGKQPGSLAICSENADPCVTDPGNFNVDLVYWNVDEDGASQANVLITPSPNLPAATYDVQVTSRGATGSFHAAPAPQNSTSKSNRAKVTPVPSSCTVCTITGLVTTNDGKAPAGNIRPMANARMTLTIGLTTTTIFTDRDGKYTFDKITAGSSAIIQPAFSPYKLVFSPKNPDNSSRCQPNPTTCFFYNIRSNQSQDFTTTYTTVFLLHGLGQGHEAMQNLWTNLTTDVPAPSVGLNLSKFVVDDGFDFSECGNKTNCSYAANGIRCSLTTGAISLAQYVQNKAPADYVLVGYSMGGLIARRMLANTTMFPPNPIFQDLVAAHRNVGLITLGTPNWGYPFLAQDSSVKCPWIVNDMSGSWNPSTNRPNEPSQFLVDLTHDWNQNSYRGYWFQGAGTYCQDPFRNFNVGAATGCLNDPLHKTSDGVVCTDSALFSSYSPVVTPVATDSRPIQWSDPTYVHTTSFAGWGSAFIFCPVPSGSPQLFDPPLLQSLYNQIVQVINNGY